MRHAEPNLNLPVLNHSNFFKEAERNWNQLQPISPTIIPQSELKARLVLQYFKTALFDLKNYHQIDNTNRFEKALNRYFDALENDEQSDYFQKVTTVYDSFGKQEYPIHLNDDAIFTKVFPFNQIKEQLTVHIRETYKAMFNWLTDV